MATNSDDQKRELDAKLRMHAAKMGGNVRLPRKPKKDTTPTEPWQPKNPLKTIELPKDKKEPTETTYELTEKALAMADAIKASKGVENMMSNPIMSSVKKTAPKKDKQKEQTKQNQQETQVDPKKQKIKKDPNFTTLAPGAVRPLKTNDSVSDVIAKIYNFMLKQYHINDERFQDSKKYNEKVAKLKETRIIELIGLFGGKYKKMEPKEKKETFFSKLLRYAIIGGVLLGFSKMALASVNKKVIDALPVIPDFLSMLGIGKKTESSATEGGPAKSLSELIARGESGGSYDIYNTGTAGVTGPPLKLSEMTIGEVMNLQKQHKVFAAGKYQMIPDTLSEGVRMLGISPTEKFSPDIQERLFSEYLIGSKRPEIQKYLNDPHPDEKTIHDYLKALSKEFAAVADPDTGKSYYDGSAKNAASITSAEALAAGEKDRVARQTELAKKETPVPTSSVTVEQSPPSPVVIPEKLPTNTNKTKSQSVSVLNNNTNVVNAGDTYLVSEQKEQYYPTLIDKQYYNYG